MFQNLNMMIKTKLFAAMGEQDSVKNGLSSVMVPWYHFLVCTVFASNPISPPSGARFFNMLYHA